VAFAAIGGDRRVCFDNSPHASVHLVADQMGVMPATAYTPAAASGAARVVDTRDGFVEGGPTVSVVAPGASVCPAVVGSPGQVAVVNITPVEATGHGFGALRSSDAPSNNTLGSAAVSNVNFGPGTVDPNPAFAVIGADGRVCFDNSPHSSIQLIIDQMGSLPSSAFVPASASGATRLIDSRTGLVVGGTSVHSVGPGEAVCARAVGNAGDVAVLNGTPVEAGGAGFMAVRGSDAPSNNTLGEQAVSNWNFAPGSVDPNVAFAEIGPDGRICVDNSQHITVQMILDQAGYLTAGTFNPAATTGAARLVDTRRNFIADPAALPGPGTTTTTTLPGTAVEAPSAPVGLAATAGPGTITLDWSAPVSNGGAPVEHYRVERSINDTSSWSHRATVTAPPFTDTHLATSDVYFYRVQAGNSAGWGPWSQLAAEQPDPPTVPGAVTDLRAVPGNGTVTVRWAPPSSDGGAPITQYQVRRHSDEYCQAGVAAAIIVDAEATTLEALFSGLTNGAGYCFTVAATNVAGSVVSQGVRAWPGRPTIPAPCSAVAYSYPVQGGGIEWYVDFSWATPEHDGGFPITSYSVVWHDETSDGVWTETLTADARYTTWQDATPGHLVTVYVTAVNAIGHSQPCLAVNVAVG